MHGVPQLHKSTVWLVLIQRAALLFCGTGQTACHLPLLCLQRSRSVTTRDCLHVLNEVSAAQPVICKQCVALPCPLLRFLALYLSCDALLLVCTLMQAHAAAIDLCYMQMCSLGIYVVYHTCLQQRGY